MHFAGILHEDLRIFLEANVPSGKKAKKLVLGVADSKLGGAIQEGMGLKCEAGGTVAEVIRGVRLYFTKLVKGVCVCVRVCACVCVRACACVLSACVE